MSATVEGAPRARHAGTRVGGNALSGIISGIRAGSHAAHQTTLRKRASLTGIGVHSGSEVTLTLHPAEAGTGIVFLCGPDGEREVPADYRHVSATALCTAVGAGGASVATIEHLMAALRGLGVDNVAIEVEGDEVPIVDGSSAPIVEAIEQAGILRQAAPRRYIKVEKPVFLQIGESTAEFTPHDGLRLDIEIDFASELIGRQRFVADVTPAVFRKDLARARTFGFLSEVEALWQRGFARGASLENTVVIGEDRIVNPEGLRYTDEFVRHKALDAMGDLALAGAPILGCYRSYRGGHKLNFKAVEALLSDTSAWSYVAAPARREVGHAELLGGVAVPAYGPDAS